MNKTIQENTIQYNKKYKIQENARNTWIQNTKYKNTKIQAINHTFKNTWNTDIQKYNPNNNTIKLRNTINTIPKYKAIQYTINKHIQ